MSVTKPPLLINNATDRGTAMFSGPFEIGSNLYIVTQQDSLSFPPPPASGTPSPGIHVWKSPDFGLTWTLQDPTHAPATPTRFDTVLVGTTIYIAYSDYTSNVLKITTFNTTTNLYGTIVSSGYDITVAPPRTGALSNGTVYIFYVNSDTTLRYTTFASGVFGSELTFSAAATQSWRSLVVSGTDVIHLFWSKNVSGTSTLYYNTITSGVVSSAQTISSNTSNRFVVSGQSRSAIFNNAIYFPSANSTSKTGVWVGTPVSAPVWSFVLVDDINWTGLGYPTEGDVETFLVLGNSLLYVFWTSLSYDSYPNAAGIIDRIYCKSYDGATWSSPVIFYDNVTNPDVNSHVDPFDQFIHFSSVVVLSNTHFGVLTTLEEKRDNVHLFCAPYYLFDCIFDLTFKPTNAQPPQIVPTSGTYVLPPAYGGQPYQGGEAILRAGTESFEYSITSGVTPSGITLGGSVSSSTDPPITSSTGVGVVGTPTNPTTPTTYTFTGKLRLLE